MPQIPDNANPPSLFLALELLLRGAQGEPLSVAWNPEEAAKTKEFMVAAYPRARTWFEWLHRSQASTVIPDAFYWRGRGDPGRMKSAEESFGSVAKRKADGETITVVTSGRELNPKTLSSGLDDYPRASHPDEAERHVDLLCWVSFSAQALSGMATFAGDKKGAAHYEAIAKRLRDVDHLTHLHVFRENHDELTHSPPKNNFTIEDGMFLDWGRHSEGVRLEWVTIEEEEESADDEDEQSIHAKRQQQQNTNKKKKRRRRNIPQRSFLRTVQDEPEYQYVPQYGYNSMFPLALRLLPVPTGAAGEAEEGLRLLVRQLELLADPRLCWSPYGLRSLAKGASLYGEYNTQYDAPYWRGPIWMNVNYLIWSALSHYASVAPEGSVVKVETTRLAAELRSNLVRTLVQSFHETGYIWEQYRDTDGKGQGVHPFTGWSALLVLLLGEAR